MKSTGTDMDPFSAFLTAGVCLFVLSFAVSFVDDFGSAFLALMGMLCFGYAGMSGLFFILAKVF